MKLRKWKTAAFAMLSSIVAAAGAADAPTRFDAGGYTVNLLPTPENIRPTVTYDGRSFSFAYRTDGWLLDGERRVAYHSAPASAFSALERTATGVRACYAHELYAGEGDDRRLVGVCSNEVVFAAGTIAVRATLCPAEPGRYRFHAATRASQVIVFPDYARRWVGTTLQLVAANGRVFMNELTPHDRFAPEAWGLGANETGNAREMVFGNVPGVIRFEDVSGVGFNANRYRGGFEASAVCLNDDRMHKPAWDGPVVFEYEVRME